MIGERKMRRRRESLQRYQLVFACCRCTTVTSSHMSDMIIMAAAINCHRGRSGHAFRNGKAVWNDAVNRGVW